MAPTPTLRAPPFTWVWFEQNGLSQLLATAGDFFFFFLFLGQHRKVCKPLVLTATSTNSGCSQRSFRADDSHTKRIQSTVSLVLSGSRRGVQVRNIWTFCSPWKATMPRTERNFQVILTASLTWGTGQKWIGNKGSLFQTQRREPAFLANGPNYTIKKQERKAASSFVSTPNSLNSVSRVNWYKRRLVILQRACGHFSR